MDENQKPPTQHHLKDIIEENKPSPSKKEPPKRKLSIETSGSRDKYPSEPPETLTPVNLEIGELTPVSVQMNTNCESEISDDILEVPIDISAVLTAVENRNREELNKKQQKIDALNKENETLKEQVKKYLSAIQMLQRDDEGLERALDGLQVEKQPDYKGEAKLFEQKLVQVF